MGLSGIYAVRNLKNDRMYVGSAKNLASRKKNHLDKLRSGVHPNKHLQSSFSKHGAGAFSFEVLEVEVAPESLLLREQYWIDLARAEEGKLFNKRLVAESNLGWKQTKEMIAKRLATMAERGYAFGRGIKRSPESVEKVRAAKMGVPHPRKGDVYKTICKYGHKKHLAATGKMKCRTCRRNEMRFYNILNAHIKRGG